MKYVLRALLVLSMISFAPPLVGSAHADCGHKIIC
jgi:hypothetical protein